MKKIVTTLACGAIIATTASADFIRVEMGAGAWGQTPKGYIHVKNNDDLISLDGKYDSDETAATGAYVWAFLKHPVPIVPNLRLEYASISDEGQTTGKVGGMQIPGSAPTTFDITQYDIIPYYNILDNTFWTTIDVGIDLKVMQIDTTVAAMKSNIPLTPDFKGYSDSKTLPLPLLYLRGRVQVPFTGVGFEADAKAISDGGNNAMYDARAKVDYTLNITPIIQPGIEVGYRVQQLRVDDGSNQVDLTYAGVYAGLMLRF